MIVGVGIIDIWSTSSFNLLVPPGSAGTLVIVLLQKQRGVESMGPEGMDSILPQGKSLVS